MHFQLIVVMVVVVQVSRVDPRKSESCVTPNGETAMCTTFLDCPIIAEAVATGDDDALQFFKKSKCGSTPRMVCCGSSGYPTSSKLLPQKENIELDGLVSDTTVCGLVASSNKIKGGTVAELEEFPWLVAIEYQNKYTNENAGIRCGGSLIGEEYVLTAAHCIVHIEFEIIRAWLGVTNITSDRNCLNLGGKVECHDSIRKLNITKQIVYPFYNSVQHRNDIGLLRLESRITFTKYIRPICLQKRRSLSPKSETYLWVAGWGTTEHHSKSDIKLKVELPVQNNSICNGFLEMDEKLIDSEQLCVGGKRGKDACQGDSGGLLMRSFINDNEEVQWYQVGLVSYGVGCGIDGRPGIYTKVSRYISWLVSRMDDENPYQQYDLDVGDPCKTPNGILAKCVPLSTCQPVFNIVATRNASVRNEAEKYVCGYDMEALVCCESPGSVIVANFETLPDRTVCGMVKKSAFNISDTVKFEQLPWLVGIEYKDEITNKTKVRCSGSLISSQYVLTSAYCLNMVFKPVNVWLGSWQNISDGDCKNVNSTNCTNQVRKVPVKEAVAHPYFFDIVSNHDVGLILLESAINFTDYIRPICLLFPNLPPPEPGTRMVVASWRENSTDTCTFSEVSIRSEEECIDQTEYSIDVLLSSQKLCTKGKANDICRRDDGAPLMRTYKSKPGGTLQWYQEGILTEGDDWESNSFAFTQISTYMNWITNIISEY